LLLLLLSLLLLLLLLKLWALHNLPPNACTFGAEIAPTMTQHQLYNGTNLILYNCKNPLRIANFVSNCTLTTAQVLPVRRLRSYIPCNVGPRRGISTSFSVTISWRRLSTARLDTLSSSSECRRTMCLRFRVTALQKTNNYWRIWRSPLCIRFSRIVEQVSYNYYHTLLLPTERGILLFLIHSVNEVYSEAGLLWNHTRTVVREWVKGDEASQWKRSKFAPRHTKTP